MYRDKILPLAFIFHPDWWHTKHGICFDRDFFYNAEKRVEVDLKMREILHKRFGEFDIEREEKIKPRPSIGAVHLAAGYIISEMFGCEIKFNDGSSPQVLPKNISNKEAENLTPVNFNNNSVFSELKNMIDTLKNKFGYVVGDINWQGVLNVALDLRGEKIFIDMIQDPKRADHIFKCITKTIISFVNYIRNETGTSSISVNRNVKLVNEKINLHSNCSVLMISPIDYSNCLLKYEKKLAKNLTPYGIHHCGDNLEIHAENYSKIKNVEFYDVGWGSDITKVRKIFPNSFLNLRYSPQKLENCSPSEVKNDLNNMIDKSNDLEKTGVCCINMGSEVQRKNIIAMIEKVKEIREENDNLTKM